MVTIQEHTYGFDFKKNLKTKKNPSLGIQVCTSILGCVKSLVDYYQAWEKHPSF